MLPAQDRELVNWIRIEGAGMEGWGEANYGPEGVQISAGCPCREKKRRGWRHLVPCSATGRDRPMRSRARYAESASFSDSSHALSDPGENMVVAPRHADRQDSRTGGRRGRLGTTESTPLQATIRGIPRTHGGVSGSAVWTIELPMDGSARRALILQGVVPSPKDPKRTESSSPMEKTA